jgi:leader peptidase (prepilin peptidase)/N-methyltransferase
VFAVLGAQYGASWRLVVAAAYAAVFLTCSETDLLAHRIPDIIVLPAIALAIVVGTAAPGADAGRVWLGGLISGGVFLAMALTPSGGLGDAKLGLFAGLALGFPLAVYAVFIATISAGIAAFAILASSRFTAWGRAIPYGPYISLGALVVMLAGGTAFVRV